MQVAKCFGLILSNFNIKKMKTYFVYAIFFVLSMDRLSAQTGPWNNALMITTSVDGVTFSAPVVFQDSAGVPSIVRWHGDTLIGAFQWFRLPSGSPSWDRVAVKFSYDKGMTWTSPTPILIPDLPADFQRPFDPTLAVTNSGKVRIFFSSGVAGTPVVDSLINTYSAIANDGIHYSYEPGPRFDHPTTHVIDPAIIYFRGMWHYLSPYSLPNIAYHAISSDGLNFTRVGDIGSDMVRSWTGNYVVNDTNELRFYGSGGPFIWYNHSSNGGVWDGYVNTKVAGGDPSVLKIDPANYLMVYTGTPYKTVTKELSMGDFISVYPNPFNNVLQVATTAPGRWQANLTVSDVMGNIVFRKDDLVVQGPTTDFDLGNIAPGVYYVNIETANGYYCKEVVKLR